MTTRVEAGATGIQLHMLRHHDLTEKDALDWAHLLPKMHSGDHRWNHDLWDHLKERADANAQ